MDAGITSCHLPESVHDALIDAARAAHPDEACGILVGRGAAISRAAPARNVAAHPERSFEIEPAALLRVHRDVRATGESVIGYWHSHPNGRAEPSKTDAARAVQDGLLWIVVADGAVSGWRVLPGGAVHGRFAPVVLTRA